MELKMRYFAIALLLATAALASSADARPTHVRGHITRTGKYVSPHIRTTPDHTRFNNYSTRGNVNPYTGKAGNKPIYKAYRTR